MNPIWCDVDSLDNYNDYEDGLWRTYVDPETLTKTYIKTTKVYNKCYKD
jgi:hypothetical protein